MDNLGRNEQSSRGTRGGYTRQRQGCLTCRRRKKRCDRTYPVCGHCLRLNLTCDREPLRRLPKSAMVEQEDPSSNGLPVSGYVAKLYQTIDYSTFQDGLSSGDMLASRRAMLRYYTSVFTALISTNQENNCFLSVLMPMAFECSALVKALAAWASSHLALRDDCYKDISLRHRGAALGNFKLAMEEGEISSEMCLAVTMVFCSMDSISDRTGCWYQHLMGGAAALDSHFGKSATSKSNSRRAQLSTHEGRWLLRNFAYHDVLMSVSRNCRPLVSGDYWRDSDDSCKADPYFGVGEGIISLISQISHFDADLAMSKQETSNQQHYDAHPALHASDEPQFSPDIYPYEAPRSPRFPARAQAIEKQLLAWHCPDAYSGTTLDQLGETYRRAALLHLYRTLRSYLPGLGHIIHEKINRDVKLICNTVRQMPDGCLPECTLLFPLFMAGSEADDEPEIEIIRSKLQDINKGRYFRNVEQCLEVLDELWRLRLSGAKGNDDSRLDWLLIAQQHGYTLALT